MNYGNIKYYDIANGVGVRTSLFVSGCRNYCENCFNKQTWEFTYGEPYTSQTEDDIINSLSPAYVNGLTVLGGEPFEPENQEEILKLIKRVKHTYTDKSVWIYSGFCFEEIMGNSRANTQFSEEILKTADILVDGRFIEKLKNISLMFRGSENQRIIDLKNTFANNKITLWEKTDEQH